MNTTADAMPEVPAPLPARPSSLDSVTPEVGEGVPFPVSYGAAGSKRTGPGVLVWDTADMTGKYDGGLYLSVPGGFKRVGVFYGVSLRELTEQDKASFAVFIDGKVSRDVTHVVQPVHGGSVFLNADEAALLLRLRDLPGTKWTHLCAEYQKRKN